MIQMTWGCIGTDGRGVTENCGMAGSIIEEGAQSKCKEIRSHGTHTRS